MGWPSRLLHADPHPGNYLFLDDGRLGVLDFGCVKRFDEFFLCSYARSVLAALGGDRDAIWAFCEAIVEPWRAGRTVARG